MDNTSIITQVANPKEEEILSSSQEKVSQSKSSLKKQRSRGIFSTFFCCFQNYNVEPPSSNNNTGSSLPPPAEENGTLPKCDQVEVVPIPSPPAQNLLPEMTISDYGKNCVVIDLDETLVHSSFKPISNADFIVPVEIDGTVHQGPAEEFDASTAYPEDQDGSGDDLEISGSGSGDEGPNAPNFSTTAAPATNETEHVAVVTENEGIPDEVAGETTTTTTTTMTSEAPPTAGTPATAVAAVDVGATDATTATTTTTQAPVDPDVAVDLADTTHAPADPAAATTAAPTEIPATTAAPDQSAAPGVPWELPEDPLRETTQAAPVTTEAADTPPRVTGTSVPEATEAGPAETTQPLLTTQSSPTTAAPPVAVDTGVEVSTETPVLPEEEDEEEEEEEETPPAPTEKTDLLPASTPALETELDSTQDEMASGDDAPAAPTDSPLATESAEPAGPPNAVDEEAIIPQSRGNVNEIPDDSDMTFASEPEGAFSENQSLLERKEVLGGVIAGGVVGLAFAIMLVSLMVYRMKKKDEGSYSLDEHKHPNGGYQKARREEEFLA